MRLPRVFPPQRLPKRQAAIGAAPSSTFTLDRPQRRLNPLPTPSTTPADALSKTVHLASDSVQNLYAFPPRSTNVKIHMSDPPRAVVDKEKYVCVDFGEAIGRSSFHPMWLRDHCRCPICYHAPNKQRLLSTVDIPTDIRVKSLAVSSDQKSLLITWADATEHKSVYDLEFLRQHSYNPRVADETRSLKRVFKYWGSELTMNPPTVPYKDIMKSDEGLAEWLRILDTYGIAFASGVPATARDTEELGRRISFIRETHYGTFWDFTANNAHGDTAYTGLALPAHTDTTYFTDPIGLQLFHLIEFTGQGGRSLYVDGFNVARQLKAKHPWAYKALTRLRVPCHSAGDEGVTIAPTPRDFPILNVDPTTGELYQVRFNNDDRSALSGMSAADVELFYASLREWTALVKDPANEAWTALQPGTAVVVDNWRALHGRSSFSGHRRLTGSYHNWDDYRSRVRQLCYKHLGRSDI